MGEPDGKSFGVFVGSFLGLTADDNASRDNAISAARVNAISATISGYKMNSINGIVRPRPYIFGRAIRGTKNSFLARLVSISRCVKKILPRIVIESTF